MKVAKKILGMTIGLFVLVPVLARAAQCPAAEVLVLLKAKHANDLITTMGSLNSMPVDGKVISSNGNLARVMLSVPDWYARPHSVSSRELAFKIQSMSDAEPSRFEIKSIQAINCGDRSEDTGNAGTIGHGH